MNICNHSRRPRSGIDGTMWVFMDGRITSFQEREYEKGFTEKVEFEEWHL